MLQRSANEPDVRRVLARDLLDCKFRGLYDRAKPFVPTFPRRPSDLQPTGFLLYDEGAMRDLRQAEARGLKHRRNRGADDIVAVVGKIGMAGGGKTGEPVLLVAIESHLKHGA